MSPTAKLSFRLLAPAFFLLTLGACQTAYEAGQQSSEHQCRKLPPGDSENCLARINRKSYSDYEKERQAR